MNNALEPLGSRTAKLNAVIDRQAELLGELSQLIASLDSADPQSLERVNNLLAAGLKGLRGEALTADTATHVDVCKQAFVEKYSIRVLGDSQVSFTLPSGTSRIDLLNEAQGLAPDLLGRDAVYPSRLETWKNDSAFTAKVTEDLERSLDGNVGSSTRMTRAEQEANGWNNVGLCDLAAAHAAYFIATGKDLFANYVVRARGGALYFYDDGLGVCVYDDGVGRFINVAASAALPSRN